MSEMSDVEDDYRYSSGEEYSEQGEEEELEQQPKRAQPSKNVTPVSQGTRSIASGSAGNSALKKRDLDYFGVSPEQLRVGQAQLTSEVANLLDIPEDHASILLVEFRWDKEKLLDQYYSDPEKTRLKAGAIQGKLNKMIPTNATGLFHCPVTYEKVPYSDTLSMGCEPPGQPEHRFSLEAWQDYLISRIQDGPACLFTRCQARGCNCIVSPRVWRLILAKGELESAAARQDAITRYERQLSSNYVDMNRNIKWCPAPACGWAVQATGPCREVVCQNCRVSFCFRCGADAHAPLSCKGLSEWNEKCSNESETANWFVANTKRCPACTTHIEKNQGCNHMHCNMCKFDFCWICLGKWSDHGANTGGFYQCNKYNPNALNVKEEDISQAKRDLDRYIHYYKRYQNHNESLKYAKKQRETAEARMTELQKKGGKGWIDVQFIMEAVDQLIECRRVLKYTYAYAYQMADGPRKQLFEFSQGMLETNTETLAELSERNVESIDRAELINYTRVTNGFLRSLLEEVAREELEGFGTVTNM